MNIAFSTPYNDYYSNDKLFDLSRCKLGENILLPIIKLKEKLESMGNIVHTIDMYKIPDIDVAIFQDIPYSFLFSKKTFFSTLKYHLKFEILNDFLLKTIILKKKIKKILIMQEPEIVMENSYNIKLHKFFDKILTWNDDLVDGIKYFKFNYPQPLPQKKYNVKFNDKKFSIMICGNKVSTKKNELYSERRKVINYLNKSNKFDLYGFGWEKEKFNCYKGSINNKLDILSNYKFSFCFENMNNANGYITEKIFDCFFSNVVPIYSGPPNVKKFIEKNTFIDYNNFSNLNELVDFLESIDEKKYNEYIININNYLKSITFSENFSVEKYIDNIIKQIY